MTDLGEVIEEIVVNEPAMDEVEEAIKKLSWKAPGIIELLKTKVEFSATKIHWVLAKVWTFEDEG